MVLFISMIMYFVVMSVRQEFSLVTEDYYEKSLQYDSVQIRKSNYAALGQEVSVEVSSEGKVLMIALPAAFDSSDLNGSVHFYHPENASMDMHYVLSRPFVVSTADWKKGMWRIYVDWDSHEKGYLFEQVVFIN